MEKDRLCKELSKRKGFDFYCIKSQCLLYPECEKYFPAEVDKSKKIKVEQLDFFRAV